MTNLKKPKDCQGRDLLSRVQAGFKMQGTTFYRFCKINNLHRRNVESALSGDWKGEKADHLRRTLIKASKADKINLGDQHE